MMRNRVKCNLCHGSIEAIVLNLSKTQERSFIERVINQISNLVVFLYSKRRRDKML
jgi:hypothetical protein